MKPGPERSLKQTDVLEFMLSRPDPAFTVPEIHRELKNEFDVSDETVRNRVDELVESGYLNKKKSSDKVTMYWVTDDGLEFYFQEIG